MLAGQSAPLFQSSQVSNHDIDIPLILSSSPPEDYYREDACSQRGGHVSASRVHPAVPAVEKVWWEGWRHRGFLLVGNTLTSQTLPLIGLHHSWNVPSSGNTPADSLSNATTSTRTSNQIPKHVGSPCTHPPWANRLLACTHEDHHSGKFKLLHQRGYLSLVDTPLRSSLGLNQPTMTLLNTANSTSTSSTSKRRRRRYLLRTHGHERWWADSSLITCRRSAMWILRKRSSRRGICLQIIAA